MNDDNRTRLATIWQHRRRQLLNTDPADRSAAESAVSELYRVIDRPAPRIVWYNDNRVLPADPVPVFNVVERIFYGAWFHIHQITQELIRIGFDFNTHEWRIAANKNLLFGDFNVKRRRGGIERPRWIRDAKNMICQFDAPQLAVYEYAAATCQLDDNLCAAGDAFRQLLDSVFGAMLFAESCVLFDRPTLIALDTMDQISSTAGPAFAMRDEQPVYAVHGVRIPHRDLDMDWLQWRDIWSAPTPQIRVAMIEYITWERFLQMVPRPHCAVIDANPRWGILYHISCNEQRLAVVEVENKTAEPDGTYRKVVIPIDYQCRPLPNILDPHGVMGAPQSPTALNAVASGFGLTGEEYAAIVGAES